MTTDALIAKGVLRAIDPSGFIKNVQCDASGNIIATGGGSGSSSVTVTGNTAGVPTQAADVTVDSTVGGITVLALNANRKAAIIQNVGSANIRVSVGGTPTTTNGLQLVAGASLILESPFCPTVAVKAIREGGTSSTASVLEIV